MPVFGGTCRNSSSNALRPPAEAPMPMTINSSSNAPGLDAMVGEGVTGRRVSHGRPAGTGRMGALLDDKRVYSSPRPPKRAAPARALNAPAHGSASRGNRAGEP